MCWLIGVSLAVTSALWLCVAVEIKNVQAEYEICAVVEDPAIRYAHAYHGILASTYNHTTGDRYFYRDGKKCSLFSEAMLLAYNRPTD